MKTIANIIHHKNFPIEIRDSNGDQIYYEDSEGDWWKSEYDDKCNLIYSEDSDGFINDKRS